jgi:glutamate-5-semialdehyde dehydrogenase
VVYEVFVEAGIQGVGMACKTGNGVVSAVAQELSHTHQAVMSVLSMAAYEAGIPEGAIQVLPSASIWEGGWLRQRRYMDLIVAYGRGNWCERLRETSSVPLLEAQIGQGALYIDEDAPWALVKTVLLDKPDILTRLPELWVVLHQAWAEQYLRDFLYSVVDREYPVQVEDDIMQHFPGLPPVPSLVDSSQGSSLRIRVVPSLTEAIAWINKHSHRQLEIIFTDTLTTSQRFIQEVDSAIIYLNAFPAVQGSDPLGVAAPKLPTRGWIDLNALTTTKTLVHPLY